MNRSDSAFAERWPIERELLALGFTCEQVAAGILMSRDTVKVDVTQKGGIAALFPERPRQSDVYAAAFRSYVSGGWGGDDRVNGGIRKALEKLLRFSELESFASGVAAAGERLFSIGSPEVPQGYLELFDDLFDVKLWSGTGKSGAALVEEYIASVASGAEHSPRSFDEARETLLKLWYKALDRRALMIEEASGLASLLNEYLMNKALSDRERLIISRHYGLGGEPAESFETIGVSLDFSRTWVQQLERAGKQKLVRLIGQSHLTFLETIGDVIREREALRKTVRDSLGPLQDRLERAERLLLCKLPGAEEVEAHFAGSEIDIGVFPSDFDKTWVELHLSKRSMHCLDSAGIHCIGQLVQCSEEQLLQLWSFGKKSLVEVKGVLQGMGLRLGTRLIPVLRRRYPVLEGMGSATGG